MKKRIFGRLEFDSEDKVKTVKQGMLQLLYSLHEVFSCLDEYKEYTPDENWAEQDPGLICLNIEDNPEPMPDNIVFKPDVPGEIMPTVWEYMFSDSWLDTTCKFNGDVVYRIEGIIHCIEADLDDVFYFKYGGENG